MKEKDIRKRIQSFLRDTVRYVVVPASMGVGLALVGCGDSGLSLNPDGSADTSSSLPGQTATGTGTALTGSATGTGTAGTGTGTGSGPIMPGTVIRYGTTMTGTGTVTGSSTGTAGTGTGTGLRTNSETAITTAVPFYGVAFFPDAGVADSVPADTRTVPGTVALYSAVLTATGTATGTKADAGIMTATAAAYSAPMTSIGTGTGTKADAGAVTKYGAPTTAVYLYGAMQPVDAAAFGREGGAVALYAAPGPVTGSH